MNPNTNPTQGVNNLAETAAKHGGFNYLLGLMGFVLLMLLGGLGFIIKQNSDAIASIPRDLALLTQKLDSMDKKLDMIFMDQFEIKKRPGK
ncbi:MAG: hypothetical protein ACRCXX_14325 [Cetobacterium sp.]|uniref:hypothetical protein n=1 Tax=Cetobacterium sp. TaxID=2071632 RepID=UPI003F2BC74B